MLGAAKVANKNPERWEKRPDSVMQAEAKAMRASKIEQARRSQCERKCRNVGGCLLDAGVTRGFAVGKNLLRAICSMLATIGVARGPLAVPAALVLIMAVTPHALSQQFDQPKEVPPNRDATKPGEEPSWCHPDTPGFKLIFHPDGTLAAVETEGENPVQFIVGKDLADGTFTGTDQGCEETERHANTIRECRKTGNNYVYVDVTYLYYTCQGQKRRIFTSFKEVKDIHGEPIPCEHYQYVEDARKAQDFDEDWPGANLPAGVTSSPQGLVRPVYITKGDPNETMVIWMDQAGHEAVAKYRSDGTSEWEWTGKPPPKPTDTWPWQVPGAAESVSTGTDGGKTYRYADGTTMVVGPPDPDAATNDPKTVTVTKPDKSKQVFKREPKTGDYTREAFDPDGNPVPEKKQAKDTGEQKSGGVGMPSSAKAIYCACRAGSCGGFAVVTTTDSARWCTFGRARAVATVLTPIDANGSPLAVAYPATSIPVGTGPTIADSSAPRASTLPATADRPTKVTPTPRASSLPQARPAPTAPRTENPPLRTPSSETPSAGTPEQPRTADQTPPATDNPVPPTADKLPTPEQVTIDFNEKVNIKEVAENRQLATAEPSAAVKLKPLPPDLPGRGERTAHDKGFDKDPAIGRMDSDGHASITTDEPQTYGMASGPGAPTHYRADIDTPEHTGFIADTTGKPVKPAELASALPAGVRAATETFKLGGRTYTRIRLQRPRGQEVDTAALSTEISRTLGARLTTDTCRRTKPAPALGPEPTSLVAIDRALPATTIELRRSIERGRAR